MVTPTSLADGTRPRRLVTVWTDGACLGNPGPGGFAAILDYEGYRREDSGGFRLTTNNRMELLAVIRALERLREPCIVRVVSDSEYVVKAMQAGWPHRWRERGWRRSKSEPALNSDLWARLLDLCETHHVSFEWVRGHDGHPENERCDALAFAAARGTDLALDTVYEDELARRTGQPHKRT